MTSETITYTVAPYCGEITPMHRWAILDGETIVSGLWVSIETGEIMQVETCKARQGEGLASSLYQAAVAQGVVEVLHAPESHRTPEGHRFALSVGGESVECLHGCCDIDDEDEDY